MVGVIDVSWNGTVRLNYHGKMNAFAEVYLGQGIQEWTKTKTA